MATAGLLAALPAGARPGGGGAAATFRLDPPAVVAARDASGAPTFTWAAPNQSIAPALATTPRLRARWFVDRHAKTLGLPVAALATAQVTAVHDLGAGGTIVAFGQRVNDVPVWHAELKVLMDRTGRLVALGGNLNQDASPGTLARGKGFVLEPAAAVARAIVDRLGVAVAPSQLGETARSSAEIRRFAGPVPLSDDATVRRVLFPEGRRLTPAYQVELGGSGADLWRVIVAADDARVLFRQDLTQADSFQYRVWAETTADKRPLDGPQTDFMPHPLPDIPNGTQPSFIPPVLITMESFNHPTGGAVDPWLPAGATESKGNNVDAYTDDNDPDGFSPGDIRATTTAPGVFDRVYDTALGPLENSTQAQAAIIQLFYNDNWMHDWWYDSGFDEASKNAQASNYGRGGVEGDPLQAQAQDQARQTANVGPARNNANMSTPADGSSPRMQMYLWTGRELVNQVEVPSLALTPEHIGASFGPGTYDVTANAVVIVDGTAPTDDGCEAITSDLTGKIALIQRGTCNFAVKAKNAQDAHAVGVVIINNDNAPPGSLGNANPPLVVDIPTIMVLKPDGTNIVSAATAGPTSIHLRRALDIERDGSIDNGIVAHEWGHYLHHRLEACDSTQMCGAMSEGWADFNALLMSIHDGDRMDGTFIVGAYATAALGDYGYFGIRRYPYSTDMSKNPLTFHHISDETALPAATVAPNNDNGIQNSEPHNAGEVWAEMMFEAYMAIVAESQGASPRFTFDEARRRMSNYVVAGMKLTPVDASYTEQRDAILAAVKAADDQDFLLIAQAFAKRGAGTGAVSPPKDSTNLNGVVESFTLKADHALGDAALGEAAMSCDDDSVLDNGETGTLTVHVISSGVMPLSGSTLTVSSPTDGVSFPGGASFPVPTMQPFEAMDIAVPVHLGGSIAGPAQIELDYQLANTSAATPMVSGKMFARVDYDNVPASSATDDVESDMPVWTSVIESGGLPVETWSRGQIDTLHHAWHGIDQASLGDASLESPEVHVGTDAFQVQFVHHYQFEADDTTKWDGGIIEISIDGAAWVDVASLPNPPVTGYNGTLSTDAMNPLGGRMTYAATNPSYPADDTVKLDFGTALAGKAVKLRFRIGSDQASGADGWWIDNIAFTGITDKPFPTVVANVCKHGPHADAGPDQSVASAAPVTLDGSHSSDAEGLPLTYAWTQTSGPQVALSGADATKPTFTAPTVSEVTMLEFQLTVSDGSAMDSDTVTIMVGPEAMPPGTGDEGDGGCGCVVGGRGHAERGAAGLLVAGVALVVLRRRRRS